MKDRLITGVEVLDVRFPTSRTLAGSDAMNEAPDYSAAYVILLTDSDLIGRGITFTIGRGTEVVVSAIEALVPLVEGRRLERVLTTDPGIGVIRHADAGYPKAIEVAREKGIRMPMDPGR